MSGYIFSSTELVGNDFRGHVSDKEESGCSSPFHSLVVWYETDVAITGKAEQPADEQMMAVLKIIASKESVLFLLLALFNELSS